MDDNRLTRKNWLNLAMYIGNCGVTYASISGVFGATNTDLSKKYQTLVTPAGWAFSIWGPIFIWEGVFAFVQMLPQFCGLDSVKKIAPWWWATCIFQMLWSLVFAQEGITLALVCMLAILASLAGLLWVGDSQPSSVAEYWLIRAPFSLQCGWIIAATAVNFSVEADAHFASQDALLTIAIVSLGAIFSIALLATFAIPMPNPIICYSIQWALMGIYSELGEAKHLKDPERFNFSNWPQVVLDALRCAAMVMALASLILMVIAAIRRVAKVPVTQAKPPEETPSMGELPLVGR